MLEQLVCGDELWNHYAASVIKLRLPFTTIPTARAPRLAGQSRMSPQALVIHGLSAMSVFSDRIGVRLLFATLGLALVVVALIATVLVIRLATDFAVPGWATYTIGILLLLLTQLTIASLLFIFVILSSRTKPSFLPKRDYLEFIKDQQETS